MKNSNLTLDFSFGQTILVILQFAIMDSDLPRVMGVRSNGNRERIPNPTLHFSFGQAKLVILQFDIMDSDLLRVMGVKSKDLDERIPNHQSDPKSDLWLQSYGHKRV